MGTVSGDVVTSGTSARFQTEQGHVVAVEGVRLIEAVVEDPFSTAVRRAGWAVGIAPAAAVNVALVPVGGIVTHFGIVRSVLLLDIATERPPWGAGALMVTVHVLLTPGLSMIGAQTNEVRAREDAV